MTAPAGEVAQALAAFAAGRAVLRDGATAAPLGGGLTNRAWRVTSPAADWVVRLDGQRGACVAPDRHAELLALRTAAAHGRAPRVVHADAARGVLVLEYVAGTVWTRAIARSVEGIDRIAAVFRELHSLDVPAALPAVDARAAIHRYLAVGMPGPVPRATLADRAAAALARYAPRRRAFCHHDVHHGNVVEADRLVLLDWEYAGAGDPALDLAAFAAYHDLGAAARARLRAAYGPGVGHAELEHALCVFDCLQALWHDAAGTWDALAPESRGALLSRLAGPWTAPAENH